MSLTEKTNHLQEKTSEENNSPFRIIIQFEKTDYEKLDLLLSIKWIHSGVRDYWYKVELSEQNLTQLYVHIAHEKHKKTEEKSIPSEQKESSYKEKSFNSDYKGFKKSKKIARKVLILPEILNLDKIDKLTGNLLLEKSEAFSENTNLFIFKALKKKV